MELIFEWHDNKAKNNLKKHQISFEETKTIFNDPLLLTFPDEYHGELEERYISIGYSHKQQLLLVIHTEQTTKNTILIRIISSRKTTSRERKTYESSTK